VPGRLRASIGRVPAPGCRVEGLLRITGSGMLKPVRLGACHGEVRKGGRRIDRADIDDVSPFTDRRRASVVVDAAVRPDISGRSLRGGTYL